VRLDSFPFLMPDRPKLQITSNQFFSLQLAKLLVFSYGYGYGE